MYIYITQYIYNYVFLFELETTAFIGSPPFCHRGCGICDAFGPKTGDLGPATWPFSSCNCVNGDLPPTKGDALGKKWKRFENLLENSLNLMTKHIFAYFCQSGVIKHGDDSWKIHGWGKSLSINGGTSRSPCDKVTCQTRHDGFVSRMPFIFCRKNDWQSSLKEHF